MKKLHWANLFTLVLLMGIMVSVVAATGQQAPSLAITSAPGPELTLMNSDDLEPAGIGIETPTKESSRVDSVAVINSESASGYSRIDLAGVDNSNPSFNPQAAGVEAGLTVSVNGLVTAEADEAYVVIIPPTIYSPSGSPQPISSEDRAAIIEKLVGIGIAREDIEFESQGIYSPYGVSAEVSVSELPQVGQSILDAVEEVIGRSESQGVRFSLSREKCDQTLALARRQAVPQANKAAADLAQALGIERGSVLGATENPPTYFGFGPLNLDTCGSQLQDPAVLEPFDAEPRIEVAVSLQISYAIEPAVEPAAQP